MTDEELREELRLWRLETATSNNKKAFQIFGNWVLDDVVGKKPRTLEELSKIRGVGPIVLSRYGYEILGIIRKYTAQPTPPPIVKEPLTPKEALWRWWKIAKSTAFEIPPKLVEAIVEKMPTTLEELASVDGMNGVILELYGKGILRCLRA